MTLSVDPSSPGGRTDGMCVSVGGPFPLLMEVEEEGEMLIFKNKKSNTSELILAGV